MTLIDPPITRDGKLGYSSWCRRDQHRTCETADARCTCTCHIGRTPPTPKEPTVPEAHLAPVPDPVELPCPDCDRTFPRAQALGRHRSAAHGTPGKTRGQTPPQRKPRPPLDTPSIKEQVEAKDDYDPWVVIVGHVDDGEPRTSAIVLSTKADAQQTGELLGTLGHKAFTFRVADAADV